MFQTTAKLRQSFLDFFAGNQHQVVASSSLVPGNDPTLLFTNAGMVPFKDVFLGAEKRAYTRATSSQRCVRAGGKHNDLENVGYTARHHTFFEMLGNFSFGDYFKEEAIQFGWRYLTEVLKLPKEKLWVTVFEEDQEAADIWLNKIGVDKARLSYIGAKDNFWSMGDTGPCGPCTEIFYDHGEHIWGGPPGTPEEDGDRYIEIWNLVFMQYNRHADGTMEPLPKPSVDTGMGLERIAAILQNVHSNYEIDIFVALIKSAAQATGATDLENKSLRVIADHIRSCSFLITDGVMPSNEGRGYVLRRIIRRAVRHGNQLGAKDSFFYKVVATLVEQMGEAYPELGKQQAIIEKVLRIEEEQFAKTLDRGLAILDEGLNDLKDKVIPGDFAFKLYDTYGFPVDLTADVARDRGFTVDIDGFEKAMKEQRERAQKAGSFGADYNEQLVSTHFTTFDGYTRSAFNATVIELFKGGESVSALANGDKGIVVLEHTPFYAESGGQVGDVGSIKVGDGGFEVTNTVKLGNAIAHHGIAKTAIAINAKVSAEINTDYRLAVTKNHSATHLLHSALRSVLGEHVSQKGSLCGPERLRFDFSHFEGVTGAQLREVEAMVNEQVRNNAQRETALMQIDQAKEKGAMALFGEKYEDEVRVVTMGDFSVELCGGVHVDRTGDIGLFKILSEGGIAAGVRRIEAVTGSGAMNYLNNIMGQVEQVAALVKGDVTSIGDKVQQMADRSKGLEKEIAQLKAKLASAAGDDIASSVVEINGVKLLVANLGEVDPKSLRTMVDDLKNKLGSVIIMLAAVNGDKVSLIAGVTKDLVGKVKAGDLVKMVAEQVGGKGGGRPDMAQAGGSDAAAVPGALDSVNDWVAERL
ncbi:MAG: alanyl-tRNA synthetase [Phenylobacterium sp.]|jgi:alanyl-tRNA synthetase